MVCYICRHVSIRRIFYSTHAELYNNIIHHLKWSETFNDTERPRTAGGHPCPMPLPQNAHFLR